MLCSPWPFEQGCVLDVCVRSVFGMVRRAAQQCTHVSRMCVGLWRVEVRAAWVWSALPERGHSLGGSVRTFSQVRISRAAHPLNRFEYIGAAARPESSARSQPPPPSRSRGIRLDVGLVTFNGTISMILDGVYPSGLEGFSASWECRS